jgi:glycine C-acetyltransferase
VRSRAWCAPQEGAAAATRNLYLFRHNRVEECRAWLEKIRAEDAENGVMVVTESLSATDSDSPDLAALQALCGEFDATLLVDATHDLGALGATGRGAIGDQGMLGKLDLVTGSFARTFGASGGFVACRRREVKEYLRVFSAPCAHSTAPFPAQVATIAKALEIVGVADGQALRDRLMANITGLRRQLADAGFEVHGGPSAFVCVKMGPEALARLVSRQLQAAGLVAELVEFPAAPKDQARIRLQVAAGHTEADIAQAVAVLTAAHAAGREEAEWLEGERDKLRVANG